MEPSNQDDICPTIAPLNKHLDHHKAAIVSMNNQAVSMMARGFYQGAIATFQDALSILRSISSTSTDDPSWSSGTPIHVSNEDVDQALRRAYRRVAMFGTCAADAEVEPPKLHVISSQCNPAQVYSVLTSCTSSSDLSVAFPVTIDHHESDSDHVEASGTEFAFETGVVLFNFGLAYDCAATVTRDETTAASIRHRVHRIFHMAAAVLGKVGVGTGVWYGSFTSAATQVLLLQTVLTHSRLDLSIQLNLSGEYEECCNDMQYYLQIVEFQQRILPLNDLAIAAAA